MLQIFEKRSIFKKRLWAVPVFCFRGERSSRCSKMSTGCARKRGGMFSRRPFFVGRHGYHNARKEKGACVSCFLPNRASPDCQRCVCHDHQTQPQSFEHTSPTMGRIAPPDGCYCLKKQPMHLLPWINLNVIHVKLTWDICENFFRAMPLIGALLLVVFPWYHPISRG